MSSPRSARRATWSLGRSAPAVPRSGVLAATVPTAGSVLAIALQAASAAAWALSGAASAGVESPAALDGAVSPSPGTHIRLYSGETMLLFQQPTENAPPSPGGADDRAALATKLSNPVAAMISVPLQFNFDRGYGPKNADRLSLNVQPVVPFSISEDWNLILRTIVPVISQESPANSVSSATGLGDVTQSVFFSPKEAVGGWILAAGPVALWPTGTSPALRSEQLGLGPTVLALRQVRGWTYGLLANHLWGLTESDDHPDVNATFLQPFISYTWPTATTLSLNAESTYDWTGGEWTVPVNAMLAQVFKIGGQPFQLSFGGRYFAERPDGGAEWGLRLGITLLFPR